MTYEVKREAADPFSLMCSDCPVDYIEYWEEATEEELHEEHQWQCGADYSMPEWEQKRLAEQFGWEPTPADFNDWLAQAMADGYIRVKEV